MTLLSLAFASLARSASAPVDEDGVRAWVRRAQAGDREAAAAIYTSYADKVYRTVRPLARSDAEAEDLTQDTFAKAFEALDRYEAREGVRFVSWLLTIALNLARRAHRKRGRMQPVAPDTLELGSDPDPALPPDLVLDRATLVAALMRSLETLPAREREVVGLTYGGELTSAEVADATGTSAANIRKILERARRRLRAAIQRDLTPEHPLP